MNCHGFNADFLLWFQASQSIAQRAGSEEIFKRHAFNKNPAYVFTVPVEGYHCA